MGNIFSYNSPVYKFMSLVGDLVILNLLWVISSIPIVTIGCATASLDYCCLRLLRNEGSILKDYLNAFKSNLKQMIPIWLLIVLVGTVLAVEGILCYTYDFTGRDLVFALFIVGIIGFIGVLSFLFPLQAQFSNAVSKTCFNAVAFAVVHWKTTIKLVLVRAIPVVWFLLHPVSFEKNLIVWAVIGVAVIEYLCAWLIIPIFKPFLEKEETIQTEPSNSTTT